LELGKEMLEKPIELLDGVEEVLQQLQGKYRLVVATKGDLLDQERKLKKSGLENISTISKSCLTNKRLTIKN
jgi:putative hydrolase of the HAD superfamily